MFDDDYEFDYDKIVEEELKRNTIPYKIVRKLPNGNSEIWTLDELSEIHLIDM